MGNVRMRVFFACLLAFAALLSAAPLSQAQKDWYSLSGLALVVSALLLSAIYMAGTVANSNEMKFLAHEEAYQWVATALMAGVLFGAITFSNDLSKNIAEDFGYSGQTVQEVATASVAANHKLLSNTNNLLVGMANKIGKESSKSAFCTLQGASLMLAGCGGYRTLLAPLPLASNAVAVGFAELEALGLILNIGASTALTILLPVGIFLRTFKLTRAAGGLLIALAVTLYLVVPLGILLINNVIIEKYLANHPIGPPFSVDPIECNPWNVGDSSMSFGIDTSNPGVEESNLVKTKSYFKDTMLSFMDSYIFQLLIRITLPTIAAILIMVISIRYLSMLAGAEVDVTALSKIA